MTPSIGKKRKGEDDPGKPQKRKREDDPENPKKKTLVERNKEAYQKIPGVYRVSPGRVWVIGDKPKLKPDIGDIRDVISRFIDLPVQTGETVSIPLLPEKNSIFPGTTGQGDGQQYLPQVIVKLWKNNKGFDVFVVQVKSVHISDKYPIISSAYLFKIAECDFSKELSYHDMDNPMSPYIIEFEVEKDGESVKEYHLAMRHTTLVDGKEKDVYLFFDGSDPEDVLDEDPDAIPLSDAGSHKIVEALTRVLLGDHLPGPKCENEENLPVVEKCGVLLETPDDRFLYHNMRALTLPQLEKNQDMVIFKSGLKHLAMSVREKPTKENLNSDQEHVWHVVEYLGDLTELIITVLDVFDSEIEDILMPPSEVENMLKGKRKKPILTGIDSKFLKDKEYDKFTKEILMFGGKIFEEIYLKTLQMVPYKERQLLLSDTSTPVDVNDTPEERETENLLLQQEQGKKVEEFDGFVPENLVAETNEQKEIFGSLEELLKLDPQSLP